MPIRRKKVTKALDAGPLVPEAAPDETPSDENGSHPKGLTRVADHRAFVYDDHDRGPLAGNTGQVVKSARAKRASEYRSRLATILDSEAHFQALEMVLTSPDEPTFASVYRTVVEQVHGKPDQKLEVEVLNRMVVIDV